MSSRSSFPSPITDHDLLRLIQNLLPSSSGDGLEVTLERQRSEHASSYDVEVVTARTSGGAAHRFFLKNFAVSQRSKDEPQHRRNRELRVYRDLLPAELDTPKYYASMWEPERGIQWLLLEFVAGTELRYCTADYWIAAAAWLGRLQSYFAARAEQIAASDFLARHDEEYFMSRAEVALRNCHHYSPSLAATLTPAVTAYSQCVSVMVSQPTTLVHGAYRPQNILVSETAFGVRICPADWERAAIGGRLYDLACLCDGFESPTLEQMWDAYGAEAAKGGISLPDRHHMRHVSDCVLLHRVMNWLSMSRDRGYSVAAVQRLVNLATRLTARCLESTN